ncbi:hypothetical protein DBR36_11045 [Microbacterium sp. HMWF026]|nr:hypothetical protein DBR36_11045 [Microbacterium sp. HMWF026]
MNNEPLTVYSNEGCMQCTATLRALEAAGLEFEVVNLSTDPEALAKLKAAGFLQAPVVETVDHSWSGFRPDKIDDVAKRIDRRYGHEGSLCTNASHRRLATALRGAPLPRPCEPIRLASGRRGSG